MSTRTIQIVTAGSVVDAIVVDAAAVIVARGKRIEWDGDGLDAPEGASFFDVEGAAIGWIANGKTLKPRAVEQPPSDESTPSVPSVLSMRQAKLQLSRAGLLDSANRAIGTMTGQAGEEARIEWEYATELRRDHPLVDGIGQALKLTAYEIDGLFVEAARIT